LFRFSQRIQNILRKTSPESFEPFLYIDLATRWVRKVTLDESVVAQTAMPGPTPKIDATTVRPLLLRLISKDEFEKD